MKVTFKKGLPLAAILVMGCGDDGSVPSPDTINVRVPETYAFDSRFGPGSGVDYGGQIFRHVLISDLTDHIAELNERLRTTGTTSASAFLAEFGFYYDYDADVGSELSLLLSTEPETLQKTYGELHSGTTLNAKVAGNDEKGQHKDWSVALVGAEVPGGPEALIRHWLAELAALAAARSRGALEQDWDGEDIVSFYVTSDGRDLRQLVQKFLLGAITYSQGADDYLDDDTAGKGLLSDNTVAVEGKPYTALEHAWDEGFGYFGASREYADFTDDEAAGKGGRSGWANAVHDTDGDGRIDLKSEKIFGHAVNAAKRDRGSAEGVPTDFTGDAMQAFLRGRAIISAARGALDEASMSALRTERDKALLAWEKTIAATVVHYINEVIADGRAYGSEDYSFADYAKHWSELKGFALSLQFNRRSAIDDQGMEKLHALIGEAPVVASAFDAAAESRLNEARTLLRTAYDFEDGNLRAW